MQFETPNGTPFEISDDWWLFADMDSFNRNGGNYYPYPPECKDVRAEPLVDIEPPTRAPGVLWFKKYKLVPILLAFSSPECALPPVEVSSVALTGNYRFKVHNGFHRYYASVAAGYTSLPVVVREHD